MTQLPVRGLRCATAATARPATSSHHRMFMVYLDLDELPECFDGHAAVVGAAARARVVPPRRLPRRPAHAARAVGARARRRAHRRDARRARSGCSRTCATSGTASTRSASTTATTAAGERVRGGRRRGHQHALGRAPRLRDAGRARRRPRQRERDGRPLREGAARLAAHGHGAHLRLAADRARRAPGRAHRLAARRRSRRCSTRRSRSSAAS